MMRFQTKGCHFLLHYAAIVFLSILGSTTTVFADCSTDNPATCSYVTVNQKVNVVPRAFTASPQCKSVSNNACPADILVPMGTQAEWSSFLTSSLVTTTGSCVSISDCDNYSWAAGGFGACSAVCGGGVQTQTVSCQQYDATTGATTTVASSLCPAASMPATSQSCNTASCPVPPAPPAATAMMDIVGLYTKETCGNGGGCTGTRYNASSDATTLASENEIVGGTSEATFYSGIDFGVILFSSDQKEVYSSNWVYREGGSAYQVYKPVACQYQGDIDAGYQCFETAVTYECTGPSGRASCNTTAWEEQGSATSVGYTGTQYQSDGFNQCPDYPSSSYGACYH